MKNWLKMIMMIQDFFTTIALKMILMIQDFYTTIASKMILMIQNISEKIIKNDLDDKGCV